MTIETAKMHDTVETPVSPQSGTDSGIIFRKSPDNRRVFIKGGDAARIHYNPTEALTTEDYQDTLVLSSSSGARIPAKRSLWFRTVQTVGVLGSIAWITLCVFYFILEGGFVTQTPYEMGIFVAGMIAPIAFFWMILSYMQRNSDVRYYAESLRDELHTLFFPSDEDSRRVNRDIERMTLQAAELAASSKAALKAIHRTRQGLRHEIKEFANLARKAEDHILGLSDGLIAKSGSLDDLTSVIEQRISVIADKSKQSITQWDEASVLMIERASEIESTMDKGANRILSMADVAEEKSKAVSEMFDGTISSLGLTVDAVIDRLGGINDEFAAHIRVLERSGEELSKESGRLEAVFEDQIEQINDATGRSVEAITQSLITVNNQKEVLEESAAGIARRAESIAGVIGTSVDRLDLSATEISSKAEAIENRISEKATMIAAALDGLDDQIDRIDTTSEIARNRLTEGVESAVEGAGQISETIRRGVETLTRASQDAVKQATAQIDVTIDHVQQLKDVGAGNVASVEHMVELLERCRLQIEKSAQTSQIHVDVLSKAVDGQSVRLEDSATILGEQVKLVTCAIEEPIRMLNIAMADADGRHEQIQSTLERRVHELREASRNASESVESIRHALREQTHDISTLAATVSTQAKTLNDDLRENRDRLHDTVDTTLDDMSRLIDGVARTEHTLDQSARKILDNIKQVSEEAETSLHRMNDSAGFAVQALAQAGEALESGTIHVEERTVSLSDKIAIVTQDMLNASDKIIPVYDRLECGAQQAMDQMARFSHDYTETAETTLSRMEKAGDSFDSNLFKLQDGVKTATETLRETSTYLDNKLDDIKNAAQTAHETIHKLAASMDGQSSDIHILTDQTVLKVETIQQAINEQFVSLTTSVAGAVSQIEEAGLNFEKRAGGIMDTTSHVINRITNAGDEAHAKTEALKQASIEAAAMAHQAVTDVTREISTLDLHSEKGLANLQKTSDSLAVKSKEVEAMMRSVLEQAKSYTQDMRDQVRHIAAESDHTATTVSQSVSTLLGTMDDINTRTKSVVSVIGESNRALYEQSGRFVTAVAKSAEAAEQATDMFSRQSEHLLKASRIAVEKTAAILTAQQKVGAETFLSSARFVLESLHSLSVDLVRAIDGKISDKDWKSYKKGDVAVFTAVIAQRLDSLPADKIRTKYTEDTEFRSYVQKFMRHYEDILDQTDSVDRGAVLGTTFAASDVGKIYRYLADVIGREIRKKAA